MVERDVQSAAVASVAEVLIYTLGSAAKWADGQTGPQGDAYARETLEAVVQGILVPEALRGSNAASSAVFQVKTGSRLCLEVPRGSKGFGRENRNSGR